MAMSDRALTDIKEYSAFMLAEYADCASPNRRDSHGALLLTEVRDAVVEMIESGGLDPRRVNHDGEVYQAIQGCGDEITYLVWARFVDLGGYQQDSESGEGWVIKDACDWTNAAMGVLWEIMDRLAFGLAQEWANKWECPVCGDTGKPLICGPGECYGTCLTCDGDGSECVSGCPGRPVIPTDPLIPMIIDAQVDSDMRRIDALVIGEQIKLSAFRRKVWGWASVIGLGMLAGAALVELVTR